MINVYREPAKVDHLDELIEEQAQEKAANEGPGSPWPWVILGLAAGEFVIAYFAGFHQAAFVAMGGADLILLAIIKVYVWGQKIADRGNEEKKWERTAYSTLYQVVNDKKWSGERDLKTVILEFNKTDVLPKDADKVATHVYQKKTK